MEWCLLTSLAETHPRDRFDSRLNGVRLLDSRRTITDFTGPLHGRLVGKRQTSVDGGGKRTYFVRLPHCPRPADVADRLITSKPFSIRSQELFQFSLPSHGNLFDQLTGERSSRSGVSRLSRARVLKSEDHPAGVPRARSIL